MNTLAQIENLDKKYELNNANGIEETNTINYTFIKGNIPILLSAPHAVKQQRNGKVKVQDSYTGGITEYLCNTCNTYGIIRNHNVLDDPNTDNSGPGFAYKQKILNTIKEYDIKLLLDIHGCSDYHNFDFCIGTNNGENINGRKDILEFLYNKLTTIGKTVIDECFKANLNENVSRYISHHSTIPCIQLEISTQFRIDKTHLEKLLPILQESINIINKKYLY